MFRFFDEKNFIEYGEACKTLAKKIVEEKPDAIIIPLMGGLIYTHALKYIRLHADKNPKFKKFLENIALKKTRVFYIPASGSFEIQNPEFKGFRKLVLPSLVLDKARELYTNEGFNPRKVLLIDEAKSGSSLVGTVKVFNETKNKLNKEGFNIELKALVMREPPGKRTQLSKEYVKMRESGRLDEVPVNKVVTMDSIFYPIVFKSNIKKDIFGVHRLVGVQMKPHPQREPYKLFVKALEKYFKGEDYIQELAKIITLLKRKKVH